MLQPLERTASAMTECNQSRFGFATHFRRDVVAEFSGGAISSDGGALLLRETDRKGKTGSGGCHPESSRAGAREFTDLFHVNRQARQWLCETTSFAMSADFWNLSTAACSAGTNRVDTCGSHRAPFGREAAFLSHAQHIRHWKLS
jgi:hypothetical protein